MVKCSRYVSEVVTGSKVGYAGLKSISKRSWVKVGSHYASEAISKVKGQMC